MNQASSKRSLPAKFQAFISYKHGHSSRFAERFEHDLKSYAKSALERPWKIFRDEKYITPGHDLPNTITEALGRSEFLILLASPEAAKSDWVASEIDHWFNVLGRPHDNLIIILTSGTISVDAERKAIRWDQTTALPPCLEDHLRGSPLFVDLANTRASDWDMSVRRYRAAINAVAAAFRGISPAEMSDEAILEYRRNIRNRNIALGVFFVLTLLSISLAFYAQQKQKEAEENGRRAYESGLESGANAARANRRREEADIQRDHADEERRKAVEEKEKADKANIEANTQKELAQAAQANERDERVRAETARKSAESRRLAFLSEQTLEKSPGDALTLARRAQAWERTPESRSAILSSGIATREVGRLELPTPATAVDWHPTEPRFVVASAGSLGFYDVARRQSEVVSLDQDLSTVRWSPSGEHILAISRDSRAVIYTRRGVQAAISPIEYDVVGATWLGTTGGIIVGTTDGRILEWKFPGSSAWDLIEQGTGEVHPLAATNDGAMVAVVLKEDAFRDGLAVWEKRRNRWIRTLNLWDGLLTGSIRWSPQGHNLAYARRFLGGDQLPSRNRGLFAWDADHDTMPPAELIGIDTPDFTWTADHDLLILTASGTRLQKSRFRAGHPDIPAVSRYELFPQMLNIVSLESGRALLWSAGLTTPPQIIDDRTGTKHELLGHVPPGGLACQASSDRRFAVTFEDHFAGRIADHTIRMWDLAETSGLGAITKLPSTARKILLRHDAAASCEASKLVLQFLDAGTTARSFNSITSRGTATYGRMHSLVGPPSRGISAPPSHTWKS